MSAEQDPPDGLNPSDLFVRKVLYHADEPLTRQELQDQTGLPKRTVNYALERLKRLDEVERLAPESERVTASPRYVYDGGSTP